MRKPVPPPCRVQGVAPAPLPKEEGETSVATLPTVVVETRRLLQPALATYLHAGALAPLRDRTIATAARSTPIFNVRSHQPRTMRVIGNRIRGQRGEPLAPNPQLLFNAS
jgi:hypothetical protein